MKRYGDKSGPYCPQSGYRARRIVDMCFFNENHRMSHTPGSDDDFITSENIFGHDTALDVLSSITRTLESLENRTLNESDIRYLETTQLSETTFLNKSDGSVIDNSIAENNDDYQLTELPILSRHDSFSLMGEGPEMLCEESNSQSVSSLSQLISNTLHRSPVTVQETPDNSSTGNSSSSSDGTDLPKKKTRIKTLGTATLSENEKIKRNKRKYPLISIACKKTCSRKCSRLFSDIDRVHIWENFWRLSSDSRLKWLARHVQLKAVSKRTIAKQSKRNTTRLYFLDDENGHSHQVCKTFLLNTLGYKNDSAITTVANKIQSRCMKIEDKRGRNKKQRFDTKHITEHIMQYKPCIAHYRRHNAPKIRYLNQDITLVQLYKDYIEQYPNSKCCIELYRKTLKDMHISLHRPQNDKCFDCLNFEILESEVKATKSVLSLKILSEIAVHKEKAKQANSNYKADEQKNEPNTKIFSMDLEKSLLIPMIPDVKDCFFTSRLIVFNLTFAGLKKNDPTTPAKCILWHEETSGREARNIVDAIYKLLLSERDIKHFVFWADNCTSQNKNWFLFTALATIVNIHEIETITIKYLTKGHTHMSADGVHGNIERNIRKTKNIYDFEDFKNCVRTCRKGTTVLEVTREDIFNWNKKKRAIQRNNENDGLKNFFLKDIVEIKFVKGERSFLYKKAFKDSYVKLDFLQKKYSVHELPKHISCTRGVHPAKQKDIIEKLVPLMPSSRQTFWHQLKQNPSSVDLIDEGDIVDFNRTD